MLTKTDPYVQINFAGKSVKTKVIKNNLSPEWNEEFIFPTREGGVTDLNVNLLDKDHFTKDDKIAEYTILKQELPQQMGEERQYDIPIESKKKH